MSSIAVIDLETTGLSPRSDRVIELGVVVIETNGTVIDEYVLRAAAIVNPPRRQDSLILLRWQTANKDNAPAGRLDLWLLGKLCGSGAVKDEGLAQAEQRAARADPDRWGARRGRGISIPASIAGRVPDAEEPQRQCDQKTNTWTDRGRCRGACDK